MRTASRLRLSAFCLLMVVIGWSTPALAGGQAAQRKVALNPLPGHVDSVAMGINDRGIVVGNSSSVDDGAGILTTAVIWDGRGNPTALAPLTGDDESFATAINKSGMVVGQSRNSSDTCPVDTAVMWLPDGTPQPLWPLAGDRQSVADGVSDQGLVAGTSKGFPADPEVSCDSVFTPITWDADGTATALTPLEGFPEGYASTVTSSGDVIGGSANTTTGFDFQGTVWSPRKYKARRLDGPDDSFLNTPRNGNSQGMAVGDSYDLAFASRAVMWDADGVASLRLPPSRRTQSSGRSVNVRGRVAGVSFGDGGSLATVWSRKGKPTVLQPLPGDSESEAMAINRSGQVAGRSFGSGSSTAVLWITQ